MPVSYAAFGLSLVANREIPGLLPSFTSTHAHTRIRLGESPPSPPVFGEPPPQPWYTSPCEDGRDRPALQVWTVAGGAYFRLRYSDGTEFWLDRAGTQIWTIWPEPSTVEDTATYLLGPVLGFVLRLRGVTCLHASAVAVDGRAVALVGPPTAGKSTGAAAFSALGYPVISDDIVALSEQPGQLHVQPGYPQLRLWPDSVALLYGTAEALPRLTPTWDKRALDLTRNGGRFQNAPLPLAAVYLLDGEGTAGGRAEISDMRARDALMTLVANSYVNYLLDADMREREFAVLGRLVTSVPVRRVPPRTAAADPSRFCTRILDDLRTCTGSPVR